MSQAKAQSSRANRLCLHINVLGFLSSFCVFREVLGQLEFATALPSYVFQAGNFLEHEDKSVEHDLIMC
jgi:hypothetical protein